MRSTIVLLFAIFAVIAAYPHAQDDDVQIEDLGIKQYNNDQPIMEEEAGSIIESHYRQKRATCDLGSALNINHAGCAAHCIVLGYKGGWCNEQAVCNCRN